MDNYSTSPAAEKPASFGAPSSAAASIDDVFEDSCSICLEPFTAQDPSTVTTCKHEYHLQCILEWLQRSKECPICWRILTLEDPSSQELVDAVERETGARSGISLTSSGTPNGSREGFGSGHDVPLDLEFHESIMQQIAAMLSQNRGVRPRERERSFSTSRLGSPVFRSRVNSPRLRRSYEATGEETPDFCVQSSGGDFVTSDMPICFNMQPPSPVPPGVVHSPRYTQRPCSPENSSFSESLKSKFSSASARYKESISKGTRSLKERILARNSVKELGKGVQHEISAGFARLIEHLDSNSKQCGTSLSVPSSDDVTAKSPIKGKGRQEDTTAHCESSYAELYDLGTIPGRLEIVPSQGGH